MPPRSKEAKRSLEKEEKASSRKEGEETICSQDEKSDACSSEEASQSQVMKAVKERKKQKKYVTYPLVVEE